jgi:hypothetical protein
MILLPYLKKYVKSSNLMKRMDRIAVERGSNPVGSNVTNATKVRNDND